MNTKQTCDLFSFNGEPKDQTYIDVRDLDIKPYPTVRQKCKALWEHFIPLADTKFISQFANHFSGGYWEMLLAQTLREQDFMLASEDDGPDIRTTINDRTVYFEAICPTSGDGDNEVLGLPASDYVQALKQNPITLRLTSAFVNKCRAFQKYLDKGVVAQDDILVIAINGSSIPDIRIENRECPEIVKIAYGIGSYEISKNLHTGKVTGCYLERNFVVSPKGSQIPTNLFLDLSNRHISAVLYTYQDAFNSGGYYLVHNPNATNPLPMGYIKGLTEFSYMATGESGIFQFVRT